MTLIDGTAVVTGAANGIGRAIARRFLQEGARVHALDIDRAGLDRLREASDARDRLIVRVCDCSDADSVGQAADAIGDGLGVVVHSAGTNPAPRRVTETAPADWDRVIDTNLRSAYLIARALLPRIEPGGTLILIGSILGLTAARDCAAYTASKGGLIALTRSMALDYAPDVRVNCICPGPVDTTMFEEYLDRTDDPAAERERVRAAVPLERIGRPEDVAGAAAFLASADASWITGAVLVVDGGDSI